MKKALLSIRMIGFLFAIIGFSSCENWDLVGISGSGPIISSNIETEAVEGIILEIPATVYISQGDTQSISIDAQENIFNNIDQSSNGGVLTLKFDNPVAKAEPIVVHMTIKSLKEATINGSGGIFSQTELSTNGELKIKVSGSGDIDLQANAQTVNMTISGSGSIKLISVCENMNGEINGSGDINLNGGHAESSSYTISGSGNIIAFPFITESCLVRTNGSGDVKVNVNETLDVKINGSGDVYYQGNPSTSISVNGSGDVICVN